MCGRYARAQLGIDYVVPLATDRDQRWPLLAPLSNPEDDAPSWNVAPGTRQLVLYPEGGRQRVRWGYLPAWAAAKQLAPLKHARVEKLRSSAWAGLLKTGRVIVPADYWYEWVKADDGGKQPFAIHRKGGGPLWMAGLTNVPLNGEQREGDGFVIVTAAADAGLVDVHDRRPVVFAADAARLWLDPATPVEVADDLVHNAALPADAFEWFKVSRQVNSSRNDGPNMVDPL